MVLNWTKSLLTAFLTLQVVAALPQDQETNNVLSNSGSSQGQILGNTIVNYNAPPGSKIGSFTATIPNRGNTLSNVNSSNGKVTGNTIVNYHAAGSDPDSGPRNVLSNVDSSGGNISNNRIINYYGKGNPNSHLNQNPNRYPIGNSPGISPIPIHEFMTIGIPS